MSSDPKHAPTSDRRPGLAPPRFRLRTLMWVVAGICVWLAAAQAFGAKVGAALLLLGLAVIAHVAGNAIGMQLRRNGDRPLPDSGNAVDGATISSTSPVRRPQAHHFAPATRLRDRAALSLLMPIITVLGAIAGAVAGCWVLQWFIWQHAKPADLAIGAISFGVLGAWAGFWASSFCEVFFLAVWQALRHSSTRKTR